ncbi:hypothetical protein Lal_00013695 [Lupinus albus]|nr:hypothetical protein Lal_00013695 [Lupinus albus]
MATGSEVVGSNGAPSFKKGVRAEVQVIDVQYLIDLVPKIPKDVQEQFEKEYGRLIDLILITVNTEALKAMSAMIQYWNPTLRVFEFPNLDAPQLLKKELIGTRPEPFDIIKQGEIYGLKTAFLKKHLIKTIEQGDCVLLKPAFALAIYGVVLFPFVYDMVDQAAIDVFTKFKKFLVNPVPAVLAETLLSFQMCHERGVHKVRCCIQLLFVWMMTRFKHHQYPDWSRYPLRRFRKIAINPMQLSDWKKIFVEITPRNFGTKCGLYDRHPEIMYSCGDFTNMMLMGPRGCITFNPALILGQLKWGMMPVSSELVQGSMVWYKDGETSKETLISIRNALKRIRLYEKKELGEHQSYYTPEYKEWRKDRMKSTTIPPPTLPQEPPKQSEKELLQANQIRLLEAKLEDARNEIEKYGFSVEKLDKIIETQKKEHTSLKRDYASMCSTSEKYHLIRVGKEKDKKIAELIKMNEEKDEQISNMSHQLKARESLQALAQDTKNEESHAWATMKEYQAALEKTLEREDQLKTIMKEMEKAHHQALVEANNDKVYLSEQLSLLEATHDELVTRQQEWLHNWDHMLQECKWDKDRWEERCRKIIDGFGNFADNWLRNFEDARGELQMYPETELRPAMRTFYETCDRLAWKLRKWRIAATRNF